MTLVQLVVMLVVIGVLLYLINTYIPMDANIKGILNIVVIVFLLLWLLTAFGLLPAINPRLTS
jgi:hypothetical protein